MAAVAFLSACGGGDSERPRGATPVETFAAATSVDAPVLRESHRTHLPFRASSLFEWIGDSSFILVDMYDQQVVHLSLDGRELRRIGRRGSGPGEMRGAIQALTNAMGDIAIIDLALNRVVILEASGRPASVIPISGRPFRMLRWANDSLHVVVETSATVGNGQALLLISTATNEVLARVDIRTIHEDLGAPLPGAVSTNGMVAAVHSDHASWYLADPLRYTVVRVDSAAQVVDSFSHPHAQPVFLSEDEITRRRESMERVAESIHRPLDARTSAALEQSLRLRQPHFGPHALATMEDSTLLVARSNPDTGGSMVDVFRNGRYITSYVFPWRVLGITGRRSRLAMLVSLDPLDQDGQQALVTYEIAPEIP